MDTAPFILSELTDDDTDWLSSQGRVDRIQRGLPLIHQGERLEAVCVVLRGRFSVAQIGEVRDVAALGPGEMVGEIPAPAHARPGGTRGVKGYRAQYGR